MEISGSAFNLSSHSRRQTSKNTDSQLKQICHSRKIFPLAGTSPAAIPHFKRTQKSFTIKLSHENFFLLSQTSRNISPFHAESFSASASVARRQVNALGSQRTKWKCEENLTRFSHSPALHIDTDFVYWRYERSKVEIRESIKESFCGNVWASSPCGSCDFPQTQTTSLKRLFSSHKKFSLAKHMFEGSLTFKLCEREMREWW